MVKLRATLRQDAKNPKRLAPCGSLKDTHDLERSSLSLASEKAKA